MRQIILGKVLIPDTEIISFSRSRENRRGLNIIELQRIATQSALVSSMALIRISRGDMLRLRFPQDPE